ncbi:hypothetical protein AMTRI_Chr01g114150 [Amborella trichopoda]
MGAIFSRTRYLNPSKTKFSLNFSTEKSKPKTLIPQNLIKIGINPTAKSFNKLLKNASKTHHYKLLLHIYDQICANSITSDSDTHKMLFWGLLKMGRLKEAENFLTQLNGFSCIGEIYQEMLFLGLCRGDDPEKAWIFIKDHMIQRGILPSSLGFYFLIVCLIYQHRIDEARQVFELMVKNGVIVDSLVINAVLDGYFTVKKFNSGLGFFEEVLGKGFNLNASTYARAMELLCKENRVGEVGELVLRMEREGLIADSVIYTIWISGLFQDGDLMGAFRKHKEMVELGFMPDLISYAVLIDGFCKEGNVEKASGFVHDMWNNGIRPNMVSFTSIIDSLCKKGMLEVAIQFFHKLEELGLQGDEITYAALIDGLCRNNDWQRVFCLLEEMEIKGIDVTVITYNVLINALCIRGRTSDAFEISGGFFGDNCTCSTLIHGYGKKRDMLGVLGVRRRMEEAGVSPDLVTCNALIKALSMAGSFDEAFKLFRLFPEMDLVPNSITYCIMIHGCCNVGKITDALKIFDAYRQSGLALNIVNYNCIIGGLSREGMVMMAAEIFNEALDRGLVPDAITYKVLIKALLKEGKVEEVLDFLGHLEELDIGLEALMYNRVICWFCKQQLFKEALEVIEIMMRKGLVVSNKSYYAITKGLLNRGKNGKARLFLSRFIKEYGILEPKIYRLLIIYLSKKDVRRAIQLYDVMTSNGLKLALSTVLLNALTKEGRVEEAHALVTKAEERGLLLDVVAYSILIDALCKQGSLERALDLCASLKNKGISPNIYTYNSVINGLCQEGCLVQAFRLFDSLAKEGVHPTIITYSILIRSLSREGLLQDAHQLFKSMIEKEISPNTIVYNLLIHGYCRIGMMEESLKLVRDMEIKCIVPDGVTVSALIKGFYLKCDMEGALGCFYEFKGRGILPDSLGYVSLIKGLFVKGRKEESRSIVMDMLNNKPVMDSVKADVMIDSDSLSSYLSFLCREGNIQEATELLLEIEAMILASKRCNGNREVMNPKLNELWKKETSRRENEKFDFGTGATHHLMEFDSGLEYMNFGLETPRPRLHEDDKIANFDTYYAIISSLCSRGDKEGTTRVVKEMLASFK